jgi:hypothetical protein
MIDETYSTREGTLQIHRLDDSIQITIQYTNLLEDHVLGVPILAESFVHLSNHELLSELPLILSE